MIEIPILLSKKRLKVDELDEYKAGIYWLRKHERKDRMMLPYFQEFKTILFSTEVENYCIYKRVRIDYHSKLWLISDDKECNI